METVYIKRKDQIEFSGASWLERVTESGLKLLIVCAVVQFVAFLLALWGYKDPAIIYIDYASQTVSILFYLVGVLFAVWLRKAFKNMKPLSGGLYMYEPRWAILGFVIPLANLFVPYHMAQEIINNSKENRFENGVRIVNKWWALHILYYFAPPAMLTYFSIVPTISLDNSVFIVLLVMSLILGFGAFVCISLCRFVTTLQAETFEEQSVKNFYTLKPTCPKCASELRAFRAKQCPSCFANWHT